MIPETWDLGGKHDTGSDPGGNTGLCGSRRTRADDDDVILPFVPYRRRHRMPKFRQDRPQSRLIRFDCVFKSGRRLPDIRIAFWGRYTVFLL